MTGKEAILKDLSFKAYYASELSSLRIRGNKGMALCPFHEDKNPSLSIDMETGVFHCFGCDGSGDVFDFHMRVHGLPFADALKDLARFAGNDRPPERRMVATYDYTDESGKLIFQVIRFEPKEFKQRRPNGKGGWIYNLEGVEPVFYNLPEVVKANTILLVEGEKDVETLRAIGLVATCNPMGAGKWKEAYNQCLKDKDVVIIPDNDEPGLNHALNIASNLTGTAKTVKIVKLPGLPEKGDVTDYLGGHSRDSLLSLVNAEPEYPSSRVEPPAEPSTKKGATTEMVLTKLSDLLNEPEEKTSWLLDGMLPTGGLSICAAKPKAGKSTWARDLAYHVATGQPFMERNVCPGPVIYLALEEKREEVKNHFRDMGGADAPIYIFASTAPADALEQLKKIIPEICPVLLIIDPIFKLVRVKDGNDYVQVQTALEPVLQLARDTKCHVNCLHHTNKGEGQGPDAILGSTALRGAVDTSIIIKRYPKYRTIFTEQRYGQDLEETTMLFDLDTRTITIGKPREEEDLASMEKTLMEFFQKEKEPKTEAEIQGSLEGRNGSKVKALRSLVRQNMVIKQGKGGKSDPFKYSRIPVLTLIPGTREQESTDNQKQSEEDCFLVPINLTGTREQESQNGLQPNSGAGFSCSQPFSEPDNLREQEPGPGLRAEGRGNRTSGSFPAGQEQNDPDFFDEDDIPDVEGELC